jgi:hypothetical protein
MSVCLHSIGVWDLLVTTMKEGKCDVMGWLHIELCLVKRLSIQAFSSLTSLDLRTSVALQRGLVDIGPEA